MRRRAGEGVGLGRGVFHWGSCDRLAGQLPATCWRPELLRLTGRRGLLSIAGIVSTHSRHDPGITILAMFGGGSRLLALQRRGDHAADRQLGQAETGLTAQRRFEIREPRSSGEVAFK